MCPVCIVSYMCTLYKCCIIHVYNICGVVHNLLCHTCEQYVKCHTCVQYLQCHTCVQYVFYISFRLLLQGVLRSDYLHQYSWAQPLKTKVYNHYSTESYLIYLTLLKSRTLHSMNLSKYNLSYIINNKQLIKLKTNSWYQIAYIYFFSILYSFHFRELKCILKYVMLHIPYIIMMISPIYVRQ